MRFLFLSLITVYNLSFAQAHLSSLEPLNLVECQKVSGDLKHVQWFSAPKIVDEDDEIISIEFYAFYGACNYEGKIYRKLNNPKMGTWAYDSLNWPWTYEPEIVLSQSSDILQKVNLTFNKNQVFKLGPEVSYVIAYLPNSNEQKFYWLLTLTEADQDTASQIVLTQFNDSL
ncbi:MAG: hypothetical protein KDD58_02810 [Bdellovibrionales bacterium]|nr:hypothetical protein [Bdellovibrionales bacterium]